LILSAANEQKMQNKESPKNKNLCLESNHNCLLVSNPIKENENSNIQSILLGPRRMHNQILHRMLTGIDSHAARGSIARHEA
jgi:hypothetical protein